MKEQPKEPNVQLPTIGNKVMYSMMDEFSLTRLRNFIDDLIKFKASGGICHVQTIELVITEVQS